MNTLDIFTDEKLVELYAVGNNNAFNTLLLRHKRKVLSYIRIAVKNHDVANDIFQETFIKAITTIKQGRYTEKGKFSSWIMRITHNLVIDYFRQSQNNNFISDSAENNYDLFNDIKLYDNSIEDYIIKEQVYSDLVKLIDFLPDSQKEVLKMRFFQDLSFKEIADNTGVSINTALGRMRYAIMNMRRMAEIKDLLPEYTE